MQFWNLTIIIDSLAVHTDFHAFKKKNFNIYLLCTRFYGTNSFYNLKRASLTYMPKKTTTQQQQQHTFPQRFSSQFEHAKQLLTTSFINTSALFCV